MSRLIRRALVTAAVLLTATACLPEEAYIDYNGDGTIDADERRWREVEVANDLVEAERAKEASRGSRDCYEAIDRHWGGNATAKRIMWRESRNDPGAVSPSGTYRGCMQMGLPLHAHRFTAVGCSPSSWANPDCNIRAAMHLQREGGWRHWTTY